VEISKVDLINARTNSLGRDDLFHRILQKLIQSDNYRSDLQTIQSQIKAIDPVFDFLPSFEIYLRRKQGEVPIGLYSKLSAYKHSLYNQPDQHQSDKKLILKKIGKLINEINKHRVAGQEFFVKSVYFS
jgi:hypothetical protein